MASQNLDGPMRVVVGHAHLSGQMLADALRTEAAFRNPPADWAPDWDAIEEAHDS